MRRLGIIVAGAALAVALAVPSVAGAVDRSVHSSKVTAQSVAADAPITALNKGGHGRHDYDRRDRGDRDDHRGYYRGGRCYGCDGPGSRCDRYGCAYGGPSRCGYYDGCGGRGYYGGGYYGGYGCNYDYPCGPPYEYDCTRYRDKDGKAVSDPQCKYDERCQCSYHESRPARPEPAPSDQGQPEPKEGERQPAPPPREGERQPAPPQRPY